MPRRRSVFSSPSYARSAMWIEPGMRRRRGPRRLLPLAAALVALLACAGAVAFIVLDPLDRDDRRAVAERFTAAWARGDKAAMHELIDAETRQAYPLRRFGATYRASERAATVERVRVGRAREPRDGRVVVPVEVRTRTFGALRGTIALPMVTDGEQTRVRWRPYLRLPGLRPGERVRRRVLARARRAAVLGADGRRLDPDGPAAAIVGRAPSDGRRGSGLQLRFDARLAGRPGAQLRFGERVVARVKRRRGRAVRTTVRPGLQRATLTALGGRLGGVAVLRPRDGSVQALAGLAVSAPQPPGSTFKIITLAAALRAGIARPSSTYPVRDVRDAVRRAGAQRQRRGVRRDAGRVVRRVVQLGVRAARRAAGRQTAGARWPRRFGFNERPRIPSARTSTISPPGRLRDSLAVGAAAIGQDRDLATPLTDGRRRRDDRQPRHPRPAADRAQRPGRPPPRGLGPGGAPGPQR